MPTFKKPINTAKYLRTLPTWEVVKKQALLPMARGTVNVISNYTEDNMAAFIHSTIFPEHLLGARQRVGGVRGDTVGNKRDEISPLTDLTSLLNF